MTKPNHTGVSLIVSSALTGQRAWEMVPTPGWYPILTNSLEPDLREFINTDFDAIITISVFIYVGTDIARFGYLVPDDPCPLCDDQHTITIREDMLGKVGSWDGNVGDNQPFGTKDISLPCPACQIPEYLLAQDDHIRDAIAEDGLA